LHKLSKPTAQTRRRDDDDLPSIDSHSEDGEDWDSAIDDLSVDGDEDSSDAAGPSGSQSHDEEDFSDSDAEMEYESRPRQRRNSWEPEEGKGVSRLPIKHADGRIQKSTQKVVVAPESPEESEESEDEPEPEPVRPMRDDVATGARFGRPAVVDVISKGSRKDRIQAAREQIASICQEILGDPENSVHILLFNRRLSSAVY
jgi:nucleolar complex protein 3